MGNTYGKKLNGDEQLELESFLEGNTLCNSSVLGPNGMKKLIKWARCVKLSEDEILFKEGDPIERMYFVRAGYMHVTDADDGNRGLLLGAGALMDAGRLKGSGKNTEKRQKYITTARVARNCRSAEIFAISMRTYNSALKEIMADNQVKGLSSVKRDGSFSRFEPQ